MSVSYGGFPNRKVRYLNPEALSSWSDVKLVACDGSTLMTNRLMLACSSDLMHDLFLELEATTPEQEISPILTDFSLQQLSMIHIFIATGCLQIPLNSDQKEIEKLFLDFGIDLSKFGLFPDLGDKVPDSDQLLVKTEVHQEEVLSHEGGIVDDHASAISLKKRPKIKPSKIICKDESDLDGSICRKSENKRPKKRCPHCQKTFVCVKYFKQHISRHESEDKTKKWFCFQCEDQKASFESAEQLKVHKTEAHADQTLTCPKCSKVFKGSFYHRYKRHLSTHTNASTTKTYECVACGFKAKNSLTLARHKSNFGPFHDGKCTSCDTDFMTWDDHKRHVTNDHGGKFLFRCGLCRTTFETVQRLRLHRKEDHFSKGEVSEAQKKRKDLKSEQQQVCESCGKLVRSKYYEKHLINNHGSGEYPCPQCGKVVNHPQVLERHIKNFHNEFPCEQCGKTMRNQKKYNVHILSVHTPDHLKPYQCEVCIPPKGFHTKTNLREHMNVHSNERPHKCKFCGIGFNSAGNRFAHERSNHLGIKRKK